MHADKHGESVPSNPPCRLHPLERERVGSN
jgi:hypothetical protein